MKIFERALWNITHKVMRIESFRRIMVIQKEATSNFVILSIDPMGSRPSIAIP